MEMAFQHSDLVWCIFDESSCLYKSFENEAVNTDGRSSCPLAYCPYAFINLGNHTRHIYFITHQGMSSAWHRKKKRFENATDERILDKLLRIMDVKLHKKQKSDFKRLSEEIKNERCMEIEAVGYCDEVILADSDDEVGYESDANDSDRPVQVDLDSSFESSDEESDIENIFIPSCSKSKTTSKNSRKRKSTHSKDQPKKSRVEI